MSPPYDVFVPCVPCVDCVDGVEFACSIDRIFMSSSRLLNWASCVTNSVPSLGSSGFCPCSCATSSCKNCDCSCCAVFVATGGGVLVVRFGGNTCVVPVVSISESPSFGGPFRSVTSVKLLHSIRRSFLV